MSSLLVIDIFYVIAGLVDFHTLLALRGTCSALRKRLQVKEIPSKYRHDLTDASICVLSLLTILDASYNRAITDVSVSKLPLLTTLYADGNDAITDARVKYRR